MNTVPSEYRPLLDAIAAAMAKGDRHCWVPGRALAELTRRPEYRLAMSAYIAKRIEDMTKQDNVQLTARQPGRGLLYGYVQGMSVQLVTCAASTPEGEVTSQHVVIGAWVITSSGLMPAAFDRMPSDALEGMPKH